jgi:hypothetical protein
MLKTIAIIFILSLLNGCAQNIVLLGPAITGVSSGSAYHAGLSYGSSEVITKVTGKTPTENVKTLFVKDKGIEDDSENATKFLKMVNKINKSSGIKNLANQ